MNYPQLVVYENDGWLATQVGELAREQGWLVREPRDAQACLELLRMTRPSVLLVKMGRRPDDEMSLLAAACEQAPDCPAVLFCDAKFEGAGQRASLAGLGYDLGARYVMFPPLTRNLVEDVTAGLMAAAIQRLARPKTGGADA